MLVEMKLGGQERTGRGSRKEWLFVGREGGTIDIRSLDVPSGPLVNDAVVVTFVATSRTRPLMHGHPRVRIVFLLDEIHGRSMTRAVGAVRGG